MEEGMERLPSKDQVIDKLYSLCQEIDCQIPLEKSKGLEECPKDCPVVMAIWALV